MSMYIKNGTSYRVTSQEALNIQENLPAGNFIVQFDPNIGFFLQQVDPFEIPSKVYGDLTRVTERVLNTFHARTGSTGILLSGEKGSGKTLLAKNLSAVASNIGIPTIIINSAYTGDAFNKFLQDIDQPVLILFDEFEKVFNAEEQEAVLTLLDGVFPSKKLFIFTCNNKYKIDVNMQNRPGRIFYFIEYTGLAIDFITEYCQDNLNDTSHIDYICKLTSVFEAMNFDMLKALVEEMNRYNESPQEALKLLNIKPMFKDRFSYEVELYVNDVKVDTPHKQWSGNPLLNEISIYSYDKNRKLKKNEDMEDYPIYHNFKPVDLKNVHADSMYSYFKDDKKLVLKRIKEKHVDYYSMLV